MELRYVQKKKEKGGCVQWEVNPPRQKSEPRSLDRGEEGNRIS